LGGREETGEKILAALIGGGVQFIEENGGGPGVRLRSTIKKPGGGLTHIKLEQGTNLLQQKRHSTDVDIVAMKAIQLRMARAAIGWGVRQLAEKAGVTANTVTRIENGADAKESTLNALKGALEAAGIEFTNGKQPGVRLSKVAETRSKAARRTNPRDVPEPARRKGVKSTDRRR
jgi:transcriptional regulator with XRE-family HTH domain